MHASVVPAGNRLPLSSLAPPRILLPALLCAGLAFFSAFASAQSNPPSSPTARSTWTIDKIHSRIGFSVSHFLINQVTGYFREFDARVQCACPGDDFTGGTAEFTASTASIFTGDEQRDGHLRSNAFFAANQFPEMKFTGTLVKENGKSLLQGNLTIRGVTKPVSFDVTYGGRIRDKSLGIEKAGFHIAGKISRLEYGLKWNETFEGGGAIVGDEVTLDLNIEIDRKK